MKKGDVWVGLLAMISLPIFIVMEFPWIAALFIGAIILIVILAVIASCKESAVRSFDLSAIDNMDGVSFERCISEVLRKSGYHGVRMTSATGDYGVDIVAKRDGEVYAFQCKRYAKNVGVKAVQEVHSGKSMYGAAMAVVVTNRYFSDNAKNMARKLGVELWDRDKLVWMMKESNISC